MSHIVESKNVITVINLVSIIRCWAERLGYSIDEIEETVQLLRMALDIHHRSIETTQSTNRRRLLNALDVTLLVKFERTGSLKDLDEAIICDTEATADETDPTRTTYCRDLGNALLSKYERLGIWEDLIQAIDSLELSLRIAKNPNIKSNASTINCLGKALKTKYHRTQSLDDLDIAIQYYRSIMPDTATDGAKPLHLNNYANTLTLRSDAVGSMKDLHNTIQLYETTFNLTPVDHPDRPMYQTDLANSFHIRY